MTMTVTRLLGLILATILFLVCYWLAKRIRMAVMSNMPGMPVWFFWWKNPKTFPQQLKSWLKRNHIEHGFAYFWLGSDMLVFAVDPESAHFVLKSPHIRKSTGHRIPSVLDFLGTSILAADGKEFARQRPLFKSAFNRGAYNEYFRTFTTDIDKCLRKLKPISITNESVDMVPWITRTTMDVLGHTVLNYDFGLLDKESDEFHDALKFIINSLMNPWYRIFPWLDYLPLPFSTELHSNIHKIRELCQRMIEEAKQRKDDKKSTLHYMVEEFIKPDSKFTLRDLQGNLVLLMIAGHETTASALLWGLMELTNHPEIQSKLYDEIQRTFPNAKQPSRPSDFDDMVYLEAFIWEILRLHSPVIVLSSRVAMSNVRIKGQVIPKGAIVGIDFEAIQRTTQVSPEKFDPDRFTPPNKLQPRVNIPFSAGRRQCIGKDFSLIEQRLFWTRFLQEFEVLPGEISNVESQGGFLNNPDKLCVKLKHRN